MLGRGRLLHAAVLLLISVCGTTCQRSRGYVAANSQTVSVNSALAPSISDGGWELKLIEEIPKTIAPDHVRCIPDGHCWLWNVESIWLPDSSGRWRQAYKLSSVQRQQLDAIESVSMISPQRGWFITHRALYQTEDGGINWNPIPGPALSDTDGGFRSVKFRNDRRGWLAGGEFRPRLAGEPIVNNAISGDGKKISVASIWETTDGGLTWQGKELKRQIGRFTYIEFWNDRGVVSGDAGCLFTNDGGETWKDIRAFVPLQKETGERPAISVAFFLDDLTGWILTSWFEILFTHDGGKSWITVRSKVVNQHKSPDEIVPSRVVFVDAKHGLLMGGPAGTGELFETDDGGRTWIEIKAKEHFRDVGLAGGAKAFLLGDKGVYSISLKKD